MGYGFKIIVEGDYACYTRPELKVERVSYDVPTPGALEGMLKSVYWKPAIRYIIDKIIVFNEIDFVSNIDTACFMTEASFIEGKRIILGTGPVTAHEINEHISIDSLSETVRQYKNLILQICK